ncbi:MAG: VOC family protein [Phycisphaeraceae bacterium]|nr:VOC family protein [Phycisphaeraceae bacterium]
MRSTKQIFHLAIPCVDLDEAEYFYTQVLGCRLARRYDDRITLDFFGDQVVCHLAPDKIDTNPEMYPRHFGITFLDSANFDTVLERARLNGASLFSNLDVRFDGLRERHQTFALIDPSNNILEFKNYDDSEMIY